MQHSCSMQHSGGLRLARRRHVTAAMPQPTMQRSCWSPAWEAARLAAVSHRRPAVALADAPALGRAVRSGGSIHANALKRASNTGRGSFRSSAAGAGATCHADSTPAPAQSAGRRGQKAMRHQPLQGLMQPTKQQRPKSAPPRQQQGKSDSSSGLQQSGRLRGGRAEAVDHVQRAASRRPPQQQRVHAGKSTRQQTGHRGDGGGQMPAHQRASKAASSLVLPPALAQDIAQLEAEVAACSDGARGIAASRQLQGDEQWHRHCNEVCGQLAEAGDWERAVQLLHLSQDALALSPADAATGVAILQGLCAADRPSRAAAWALKVLPPEQGLYDMLLHHYRRCSSRKGVAQIAACLRGEARLPEADLSRRTWFSLVYCLAAVRDAERAHAAFARMQAAGAWQLKDCTFVNVLLDGYGSDVDGAWQWFESLRAQGFKGNLVTFCTLVKVAMKACSGAAAERAHEALLAAGVRGDEIFYNAMVKAFAYEAEVTSPQWALGAASMSTGCAATHTSVWDLQKVQLLMAAGGFTPPPASRIWGSLLVATGKANQEASVQALWAEILAANGGRCPNLNLLHAFMHAGNQCGQEERTLAAFEASCPAELRPDMRTFNLAMGACRNTPGQEMLRDGVPDDCKVCTYLLQALGAAGMMDEAAALWRSMIWGVNRRRPDRHAYLTACRIFRQAGHLQQALHAYNGMRRMGYGPSNMEFRALMLAATEAALKGGAGTGGSDSGAAATDIAAGTPSAHTEGGDIVGSDGRLAPLDLHGLSGAEARAAVLTTLSQLQEQHRRGQPVAGDLVLITGAGQHSAGGPVLRGSVQRLLASLQLPPGGSEADASAGSAAGGGTAPPSGGMGQTFSGYARFGSRQQPAELASESAPDEPLVDTGLRARHRGFSGGDLAVGAAGDARAAAQQWSHSNAVALTEAIVLDWCASARHAWPNAAAPGSRPGPPSDPQPAAPGGGSGGGSTGAQWRGQLRPTATSWMDTAMHPGRQPPEADMGAEGAAVVGAQAQPPADAATSRGDGNAGRLVVPHATLLRWLQARAPRS